MLPATAPFSSLGTTRFDATSRRAAQPAMIDLERKLPNGPGPAAVIEQALARMGAEFPGGVRGSGRRA